MIQQLADHMSIAFMPSKGQDKCPSASQTPKQERHKPTRKKINTHSPVYIMPER